jgi:hypothetical protein
MFNVRTTDPASTFIVSDADSSNETAIHNAMVLLGIANAGNSDY